MAHFLAHHFRTAHILRAIVLVILAIPVTMTSVLEMIKQGLKVITRMSMSMSMSVSMGFSTSRINLIFVTIVA